MSRLPLPARRPPAHTERSQRALGGRQHERLAVEAVVHLALPGHHVAAQRHTAPHASAQHSAAARTALPAATQADLLTGCADTVLRCLRMRCGVSLLCDASPLSRYADESPGSVAWQREMRQRAAVRQWVRHRLQPAASTPPHSPTAGAARDPASAAPPPPLVLRVPSGGGSISCARVGMSSAVLGVGRDLRVFSLSSGRQLGVVSRAAGGVVGSVDVCDEAGLLVCGSRDCTLRWFDFDSFACQRVSARRSQHSDSVTTVRFVPGSAGRRVISSGLDGRVKLWDTETGQAIAGSADSASAPLSASASASGATAGLLLSLDFVHPSAGSYVTGATCAGEGNVGEGRVALWDVRTRAGLVSQLTAPCGLVPSVSFCAYNNGIAAGGSDGVVRVYDMRRFRAEALQEVRMPAAPVSAFAAPPAIFPLCSPLPLDAAQASEGVALIPASTSPPSPSTVPGSAASSSAPSRRHIQSVCLLPDRLLALQSSALTLFSASTAPPRKTATFPFAHPVHSVTARYAAQATRGYTSIHRLPGSPQQTQQQQSYGSAAGTADARLVAMQTAGEGDLLALSSTDCLTLWGCSLAHSQQRHSLDGRDCDHSEPDWQWRPPAEVYGGEEQSHSSARQRSAPQPAASHSHSHSQPSQAQERRHSAMRAVGGDGRNRRRQSVQLADEAGEEQSRPAAEGAVAERRDAQRRDRNSRRRSQNGEHRAHAREANGAHK